METTQQPALEYTRADIEKLIAVADAGYVEHQHLPKNGLQATRLDMHACGNYPEQVIREALLESYYGQDEQINLAAILMLFG